MCGEPFAPSVIDPSLPTVLAWANGFPPSFRLEPMVPYQSVQAFITRACSSSVSGMLPPL
ncbi:MAG: hypothetical protein WD834_00305 [Actinomycetota bacterium]